METESKLGLAFVLLSKEAKFTTAALRTSFAKLAPDLDPIDKFEKEKGCITFTVGESTFIVAMMPAPVPAADIEHLAANSWLFPKAEEVLRPHKAHLIVTRMGEGDAREWMPVFTKVVAAIVDGTPGTLGIYWQSSEMLIKPDVFLEFSKTFRDPLHIWVNFCVGPAEEPGQSAGYTTGLSAIGFMEFETVNASESPGDLRERFISMALYLLLNGPVIKDGDTVGGDAKEKVKIIYSKSSFGKEGRVMRFDFSSAKKKGFRLW